MLNSEPILQGNRFFPKLLDARRHQNNRQNATIINPLENKWYYRDYVVRAFNADMPYDQFVKEQIAGDELNRVTADGIG